MRHLRPTRRFVSLLYAVIASCLVGAQAHAQVTPTVDHHQHVFSAALIETLAGAQSGLRSILARDVVQLLDDGGITFGLLLSVAYIYGAPGRSDDDEYARVRAENDWTAAQAALFPGRLRAFCSFNPLKDYALDELARCARNPATSQGIKLHFGNSDVRLELPEHVRKLRAVFRAANARGMGIVVHMRASISRQRPYGAAQARIFLEQLLPLTPNVPVQVAHFAGSGPGYDDMPAQEAMAVLADATARGDPRTSWLWFDVATIVNRDISPATAALIVQRIRQVGVERVLFGSDAAAGDNLRPKDAWAAFRQLPLTEDEFARIAGNLAPHMR